MKVLLCCVIILLSATTTHCSELTDVIGFWKTAGDSSKLEIYPCGDKLCGKVAWLKNPNYVNSKDGPIDTPKIDRKNPDPSLRHRPILGLQVIEGLTAMADNQWGHGICYDPESGNTYKCKMQMKSPDHLEMRGYVGIPLFGRTYVLTR